VTPLFRVPVTIFPSTLVDREKGTGILMVCTFATATDVQWWREEALPLRQVIGRDAADPADFGSPAYPSLDATAAVGFYGELVGKTVREAQKRIVELLRSRRRGAGRRRAAARLRAAAISTPVKFYEKGDGARVHHHAPVVRAHPGPQGRARRGGREGAVHPISCACAPQLDRELK